jgi:hypothetical protein
LSRTESDKVRIVLLKAYRAVVPARVRLNLSPTLRRFLATSLRSFMPKLRRGFPSLARAIDEYQIHHEAVQFVRRSRTPGMSTLVFGVGRDSPTWEAVCGDGPLWFVEDNGDWIDAIRSSLRTSRIFQVNYETTVVDSLRFSSIEDIPLLRLPSDCHAFDFVVVDGPSGFASTSPGRASSIRTAWEVVRPGGFVLIDDINRDLEWHVAHLVFGRAPDEFIGEDRPVGVYRA